MNKLEDLLEQQTVDEKQFREIRTLVEWTAGNSVVTHIALANNESHIDINITEAMGQLIKEKILEICLSKVEMLERASEIRKAMLEKLERVLDEQTKSTS